MRGRSDSTADSHLFAHIRENNSTLTRLLLETQIPTVLTEFTFFRVLEG
jgi:hypothetical protein